MTSPAPSRQRQLDALITDIAGDLMGVPASDSTAAMERTLEKLIDFFNVDQAFLRSHDHERGMSVLVAEWPPRPVIPDPDPLAQVPFAADPVFTMSQHLEGISINYPEESEDYQKRVESASGQAQTTMVMVPLRREDETVGIIGLIRHNADRWPEEEVATLRAIASLLAQLWGRHEAEAKIHHHAYHDDLTGLPNRRYLVEEVNGISSDTAVSIVVVDIDNMKVINDGLNYEAGNKFLIDVAGRLKSVVRAESLVTRLAGDQFAVLITDTKPENVENMAERLLCEMGRPVEIDEVALVRSVSIGVAHRSIGSPEDTDGLLKNADVAMYQAKKKGKNRVAVFDEEMRELVGRSFEIEIELRQAIEAGDQLCLHYQPEVDLRSGTIVAVEALMRWHHPVHGLMAAGRFIEAAEESGLIVEIGDFVLREAIAQLSRWQNKHPDLVMRINVSPAQMISRDLSKQIRGLIQEYQVQPDRVCIEVTEHVMIADHKYTMGVLNDLRSIGVRIALDDFGTGYSSMEQLKKLPIDAIKIDRAFMIELATSETDAAIVDATIRLAEALNLDTVAEGIEETVQVLELLKRGCHRAQGFLLARPAAPEAVFELLGQRIDSRGEIMAENAVSTI